MSDKDWYDDFLVEINELEENLKCPKCNSDYMVHVDPFGYSFMCGDCGEHYYYDKGKFEKQLDLITAEQDTKA